MAKDAGCDEFLIGYEISSASLEKQGGKMAMVKKYQEYTKIIKDAGIKIKGHFIFGFDSDHFLDFFRMWKFCWDVNPYYTVLSFLTPLPGSQLYEDILKEDRIMNLNWKYYHCQSMVIRHPYLDNFWMSFLYPILRTALLVTTSVMGRFLLCVIVAMFVWEIIW